MSPSGPESAANEAKIQREQLRIDTIDRKADGKVEGNDNATPEQVAERTQAYIGRVNDVQGRIRSLRQKVEIGKEMRNPNWPALEKACNDVEGGLAQRLVGVSVDNLQSGIPEFSASIDRFLQSLQTEDLRENRRYAAGPTDAAAVRRRSDEAYNVRLVEARKVGGVPLIDACDEVIRSNEAELAYLRTGLLPVGWRYDVWGTPEARIKAIEAALPGYRNERRDAIAALPKDQITIQKLCDRSDAAWVTFNTAKSANPVVKQAVVESLEKLIDVNLEELEHLGRYPNPGAINDKTGETISSRIGRIEQMLPTYRVEYAQARGEQAELGADTPKTTVQQLFEQLIAGTTIDAKELPAFVKTATEKYGETTLRLVVSRVALVNKLSPAVCQASGFPFRPPVDNKQLTVQLGRGVLPAQPTPEQAETVTHAYLLGRPEDLIRRKYEFVLDRTVAPTEQIAKYHTFIENETKNLANETRNDADREIVLRLANNIRSARESIKKEQETITGYQQILFHFEAALTVFDATVARNDGRQQESDRIYLKLREKYGPDLAKMDPDLGKRVTEAIAGLKSRPNQLSPTELAMVEGRDQDATKLAVDRQQRNRDSDLLAQVRGIPRSVNVNILNGRGAVTDESGDVAPPLGGTRRNLALLPVGGRRRGVVDLDSIALDGNAKYRKQTREYLLSQNGQNGVTVAETTGANDFFKIIGVSTATIKGHFTCSFDGEWFFTEEKPGSRNGPLNPNWFGEDPNVPAAERNAINALHRGLMDRSDPEVRRRREERESGPELGSYDRGSDLGDLLGPRDGIVSTSFTIEPFDSYMGRYEGEQVPVDVYTGQMQGFGSPKVFKLSVGDKQHLVGFEDSFARKLAGAPPGMTAVLRREPARPTFSSVYRVPSNRLGERPRYAQRVLTYDKLKADDLAFVRIGRSPEEMREVERRGLETLGKHSPEIVHRRNWDRNDELLNLDTTVRIKKGTLVVEYMFSSVDGVWLCRETERDGKNFNDFSNPVRSFNSGRFHPISVRYSPTDDARKAFNAIGEELAAMEGGMTGRSALQVAGEPRPEADTKLEVIGPTFLSSRNIRSATIADIEKRNVEDSHDVLRVMDNDAAVRGVLSEAGKINSSISLVQRLFEAGKDGTKRPGLVDLMREESGKILGVLNDPAMKTNLLRARVRLQELKRANTGVDKSAIDQEIDKRIKALDDMEAMLSKPDLRQFCEHIMDKSEFDIDTFWTWLERNIVTIVAIVVSCLAVVLAVFTFGITSPLAVAAISATAGVISSELTSEARFQLHQEFDSDVTSGRATFRNRSRTGAFIRATIKDEKIYNPETGRMEHADVLTHLVDPLGQDFVTGFVTTLAFMGAGAVIGKGLTVLANTRCVQGLIANSPRLNRVIAYFAKAEQGAPAAQSNMKGFMSSWGRETAEEIRDETAERIAGDWASVVFIAKKNFRPKNPTAPKTLANSDAAVRNMGEFQYETGGDPAKAVAEIQQWAAMEGANVTVTANGAITIELDGRVFLLSPDVPVTGLTPTTNAPVVNPSTETVADVREAGVKLAEAAHAAPENIVALKEFLKNNDVNDAARIDIAEKLLGRELSDAERKAVIEAHRAPGTIDNLTGAEVFGKVRILLAVMPKADAKVLLDAGVCGKGPFDARRMTPNEDYAVRQPDGRLVVATFLRVQGGQYIFAMNIGGRKVEGTAPLNNVVGYAELVNRGSENDGVILTHLQSGEPVRMDPDGTGTIRTLVYVRTSTTDENIVIMRDNATRTEYRLQKKKVFDAVLSGMDETPAPAPNTTPQFTDRQVLEQLGFGLKVKIDGRTYTCIGENAARDKFNLEEVGTGRVLTIDKAKVMTAARQSLAQELQQELVPLAPEINDTKVLEELAFGLEVELQGGRFVYSRPSSRSGHLVMKNVATGQELRFTEADVIAAGRKAMAAADRTPAPAPAPQPRVSDAAVEAHVRDPDTRVTMVIDGRTRTLAFVRTSGVDPNVFILRDVTSGVEVRQPKANVLAAARNSLSPSPQPAPLPAPEAPLRVRDLRVGETYQIRRSSGVVEQWTYLGGDIDGEPKFRGKEGGRTVEYGFPIDRVSRLPVAEVIDLKPAPKLRLSPGAIEVNGVEVKPGDLLLTRTNSNGHGHQLTFVGIDPQSSEHAIVAGPTGTRYRVNIAEVRTWNENTGSRPGEPAVRFATQDTVRDRQGNVYMVFEIRADGTIKCASTNGPPRMVTLSRAELTHVSRNPVVELTTIYEGPTLRRVIAAGDRVLVVVDKTSANPNGIVQEGWVAQTNPRTRTLEAYNPITRQYVPITTETVFHPVDFAQSNLQILRTNPDAKLLQRKFEYLNTPGRLPLSQEAFHEFFSPNADFAQANVGNCYLISALHSLRLSPHFEVLVRSAVTPVIENLPDPANRGKKTDFIVGFDVRIPMGDPKGKIVRVHMEDIQEGGGQQTVANLYLGLTGPVGFKVLEAAYTLAQHGRDGRGQINRKASGVGGLGSHAIQALIGSAGGRVSDISSGASLRNPFSEGSNIAKAGPAVIDFLNNFSTDKQFATVNTPRLGNDRDTFTVKDASGNTVKMHYTHAYSIESTDPANKTVTVVNPHDTSKPITLKYNVFLETFSDIDIVDINFHGLLK